MIGNCWSSPKASVRDLEQKSCNLVTPGAMTMKHREIEANGISLHFVEEGRGICSRLLPRLSGDLVVLEGSDGSRSDRGF